MATVRPTITVFDASGKKTGQVQSPAVFSAPIRSDIVSVVHTAMAKNRRQPYAVKYEAGMQHSAISWGVGRALSRIPRVAGGGTSRSGQGAFGNMCRKGRMYSPTKIWRRWHAKTQLNQKRYATVSAVAASSLASLVTARGHSIGKLAEVPLVLDSSVQSIKKTKEAVKVLKRVGAGADLARCAASRLVQSGKRKHRGRCHTGRVGPLVVYNKDDGIVRAVRNLPGVQTCNVRRLNLLTLAPNGTLGRFIIWTQDAVEALDGVFGTFTTASYQKKGYKLPRSVMANADLDRIINSTEIQSVLRARKTVRRKAAKVNTLTNFRAHIKLNPYALVARRVEVAAQIRAQKARAAKLADKKREKTIYPIAPKVAERRAAKEQVTANYKKNRLAKIEWAHKRTAEILKKKRVDAKKPAAKGKQGKK